MILTPLTQKAIGDITRRKLRTLLVVLGIVVGVAGLTAINITAHALTAAFAYSASERATSDVSIFLVSVDPSVARQIQAVPNVKVVQVQSFYGTRWKVKVAPGHVNMGITAYQNLQDVKLFPFQLTSGRLPGVGEIVMESSDRGLQPFKVGDVVSITTPSGLTPLTVVGLARTLGDLAATFSSFARGYMSEDGLAVATGITKPNDVEIQVVDKSKAPETARTVTALLRQQGDVVLGSDLPGNQFDPGPVNGLYVIMDVLSGIALILAGFLIINTVTTLVGEQIAIVGTMKAIGATRGAVMRGFLLTVAVYAVVGTALGLALGLFGGYQFTLFMANLITLDIGPFQVDPSVILLSAVVGLLIPFGAALVPLWSGTRITVREALSAYGVEGSPVRADRMPVGAGWTWVPQTAWLGLRGLFRRSGRAVLTLLALTLSAAAFLAVQTTTYSVNDYLGKLFSQYGADLFVSTGQPQPLEQIRSQLLSVPNASVVERFSNREVNSHWGHLVLTGVEQTPTLYRRDILRGRWFTPGEKNVVLINEQLQQKTALRIGDAIEVTTGVKSKSFRVVGVLHDLNGGLGTIGVAMMSYDSWLAFFDLPSDRAGGFMVGTVDHAQAAVDTTANRIDDALVTQGLSPFVTTAQQNITRNQGQFQILYVLLYAVAAIVALIGILGLFNTLTTSVLERRREIGIMRSLGASGRRVASVFWVEALALSALAWVAATVIGIPAAYGFVSLIAAVLINVGFAFNPAALVAMLAFTFVIATLASVVPALAAARLRVAGILRYE